MVRILVASRRPCAAEALATSSYETNLDQPLSADTFVSAAVRVVLPWSTWPIVPTFTCGLFRSNFAFAIELIPRGLVGSTTSGARRQVPTDSDSGVLYVKTLSPILWRLVP